MLAHQDVAVLPALSALGHLSTTAGLWGIMQRVEQPLIVTVFPKTSAFLSRHTVDVSAQSQGGNGTGLGVDGSGLRDLVWC